LIHCELPAREWKRQTGVATMLPPLERRTHDGKGHICSK